LWTLCFVLNQNCRCFVVVVVVVVVRGGVVGYCGVVFNAVK
jgi:hypothetical protein